MSALSTDAAGVQTVRRMYSRPTWHLLIQWWLVVGFSKSGLFQKQATRVWNDIHVLLATPDRARSTPAAQMSCRVLRIQLGPRNNKCRACWVQIVGEDRWRSIAHLSIQSRRTRQPIAESPCNTEAEIRSDPTAISLLTSCMLASSLKAVGGLRPTLSVDPHACPVHGLRHKAARFVSGRRFVVMAGGSGLLQDKLCFVTGKDGSRRVSLLLIHAACCP